MMPMQLHLHSHSHSHLHSQPYRVETKRVTVSNPRSSAMAERVMAALILLCAASFSVICVAEVQSQSVYSWRMIHRYSEESRVLLYGNANANANGDLLAWPRKGSQRYYQMLMSQDILRNGRSVLGAQTAYQSLYFSQGNRTFDFGETLGWLHYTWVDIGTPNVSFLVALDTGSDLFWVPCDCIQCASTAAANYGLDRDLSVYSPASSSTSKQLPCASSLCQLHHHCKTAAQPCPYIVQYQSNDTSTSGSLVEDVLHLASGRELASGHSVRTQVVIGCGRVQSGGFLNGGAPDGLLGLGLSDISVPSLLAKAGLVKNSFSMCFQPDDSGRIFFGDKGVSEQHTTPFLSLNGTRPTYIVGVEEIRVGSVSTNISAFKTVIDSGTSFTFLPQDAYQGLVKEFNKQVNYPKIHFNDLAWAYCYEARSSDNYGYPDVTLIFRGGGNFSVFNPIIGIYTENGTMEAFCLAVQEGSIDNLGIIGQNFMTSYRMVFDRENLKLGWSPSDCYRIEEEGNSMSPSPSPGDGLNNETPLQQQQTSPARAVAPAMAGRTPSMNNSNYVHVKSNIFTRMLVSVSTIMVLTSIRQRTWSF